MAIQNLNSLKNLKQFADGFDSKFFIDYVIKQLADEGERIINLAYSTRGFTNRTYNLHDSYVSAVFYKGKLQKETIRYVGEPMSKESRQYDNMVGGDYETINGREEANKFLGKLQFSARPSGITLVVAAAMFYSNIVEAKGYQVISHVNAELEGLKRKKYNVAKYTTHISPEYITTRTIYREGGTGQMQIF